MWICFYWQQENNEIIKVYRSILCFSIFCFFFFLFFFFVFSLCFFQFVHVSKAFSLRTMLKQRKTKRKTKEKQRERQSKRKKIKTNKIRKIKFSKRKNKKEIFVWFFFLFFSFFSFNMVFYSLIMVLLWFLSFLLLYHNIGKRWRNFQRDWNFLAIWKREKKIVFCCSRLMLFTIILKFWCDLEIINYEFYSYEKKRNG